MWMYIFLKEFHFQKIMRKILGHTRLDDGYWRIKTNQEINDILEGQNIIGFIKKQRLNWLGHVEGMAEDNNVQKIKRWKPMSKRPIFFSPLVLQPPSGVVFYSPLAGFSLLACEVS